MNKTKALVLIRVSDEEKEIFTQFKDKIDFTFKDKEKYTITKEDVCNAQIIIGYPPRKFLKDANNLEWLQMISSGVDKYMEANVVPKQTILTNAKGSYGDSQSEFMLSLLLSLMKKIHIYRDNQLKAKWHDEGSVMMLKGSTAIVIGLGDIGSEFSRLLKAFGVHVIGVRRDVTKKCDNVDELYSFTQLDSIIPRADIIAMVVPSTSETQNLMNAKRISMMKKGSVLVNTGRGVTVDNEALCDSIEQGQISGAALDVFNIEPIPSDHRAWKIKNLIITPHCAGQDYMEHNWKKTLDLVEYNLRAYLDGKKLKNIVDRDIYEFKE
jgi:phosphoglycerate dehydrogenase-like enzyme